MRIGFLLLCILFLFNPTVSAVDILPDLFGYILMLYGIAKLSDLDVHLQKAKKNLRALIFVSAGEFFVMLISSAFDSTWRLIFTFAFAALEIVYAVPMFVSLFYGISYLELRLTDHRSASHGGTPRHGGIFDKAEFPTGTAYFEIAGEGDGADFTENVFLEGGAVTVKAYSAGFASRGKKRQTVYPSDEARISSVLFVIVHAICSCLPEFTAIFGTGAGYTSASEGEYAGLHTVLCVAFGVISLAVGVLWLVRMVRYFNIFRRDSAFVCALSEKYQNEVAGDTLLFAKRKITAFGTLSVIALCFLLGLKLNGLEIAYERLDSFFFVPEFVFGILMLFAFYVAKEHTLCYQKAMRRSALYILPSVISYVALVFYALKVGGYAFPFEEKGFLPIYITYMVGFIGAMVLFVLLLSEKKRVYLSMADRAATLFSAGLHEMAERKRAESLSMMSKKIRRVMAAEYVYAGISILCMAVVPLSNEAVFIELSWMLRVVFGVGLMIGEASITSQIRYELERVM